MLAKNIITYETESIKDTLKKLDNTAEKVLVIVDNYNRLLGTVTDGDIRRYILSGKSLDNNIRNIYNKKPIYIKSNDFTLELAKKLLIKNRIELLPIVDGDNKLIDFVTWTGVFSEDGQRRAFRKNKIDMPVVIMAGGKGKRLDPFTKILPKPLIPIGDKAIIDIIIEKFSDYGIKEFYISINHKAKMIKSYFEENKAKLNIHFIEEDIPLGTAGSLKFFQGKIKDSILVSNCDIIVDFDYHQIAEFHKIKKYDITIVGSLRNFVVPYGICKIQQDGLLCEMIEKPEYNFLVNTGMYIIRNNMLELIPENQEFNITDLVHKAKRKNGRVGVFPISQKAWIDIGQWEEYHKSIKSLGI